MLVIRPTFHKISFKQVTKGFPKLLNEFNKQPTYSISELYYPGNGVESICKFLKIENDFEGLYVFYKNGKPIYTGISRHVIKRIEQHVKGKNHNHSSLAYQIASAIYYSEHKVMHTGGRDGLDFDKYGVPAKKELMKCTFRFIKLQNDIELYLFEVYVSMELGTLHYNSFKTH
jgi:predicted GIY-YIG superfamily endonuclease